MSWLNEPREWSGDAADLTVAVEPETDFWRVTHYGFTRDSGHFLDTGALGLRFRGDFAHQYDQAGLMLRLDAEHWIKAGLELDGDAVAERRRHQRRLGLVPAARARSPTRTAGGRSAPCATATASRSSAATSPSGSRRSRTAPLQSGPMCAAPKGPGFTARFLNAT